MSTERKAIKVICFLYFLDALAYLLLGVFTLAGMGMLDPNQTVNVGGTDFALQPWALAFGVFGIASAIFYFVFAMAGIRGANTPSKIGAFKGLAIVALIVAIVSSGISFVMNAGDGASTQGCISYVSIIFAVVCIVLASKVQKQQDR